jgi:hypothetical protein
VYPATLPAVRERVLRPRTRPRWPIWLGLPVAAAAGLLLLARPRVPERPYVGIKGPSGLFPPGIEIVVKRGDRVLALEPGARVHAGDALRFVYRGERAQHVAVRIVGRDGRSTPFHPAAGTVPLLNPGEAIPGSAVVDDHPGPEEITVAVAPAPFDTDAPPPSIQRHRIRLDKE